MIPQVAKSLIERYAPQDGIVLDPFCGGGAVLVEALYGERDAVGRDVNELAVLISKAKTTRLSEADVKAVAQDVVKGLESSPQMPLVDDNLRFWFKDEHLPLLYGLRQSIAAHVPLDCAMSPLFLTVFSATVRDVSLTYRNEIRLRRMTPAEIDKFNVNPIGRFMARIDKAASAVHEIPASRTANVAVGDVQHLDLLDDECTAIVCSPPYGDERNGVNYSQFSKNMLSWLGYTREQMADSKQLTLGWGKDERESPASGTLQRALAAIADYPDSIQQAVAFYADYRNALTEMVRVTRGPIVIVIGQRVLRDTIFDNGAITTELMEDIGVPLAEAFYRQLPTKRLPKMRKFGAAISREAILVFQK